MTPRVTVIIPTRGLASRRQHLRRAIASVLEQRGVQAIPLVVLNGMQCERDVEHMLRSMDGVSLLVRQEAGLAAALLAGRVATTTPWFAALDDDDCLLPDALMTRVQALENDPDCDVVVTNGVVRTPEEDRLHTPPECNVGQHPARVLAERNWLLPGSWLARTDAVSPDLFSAMPAYRECTYLAACFSTRYRMRWLDQPTVVYHPGTPHSVSNSFEYFEGQIEAAKALARLPLPSFLERRMRQEVANAYHEAADRAWSDGDLEHAWAMHLRSLTKKGGWRYVVFTRHLLYATVRRAFSHLPGTTP